MIGSAHRLFAGRTRLFAGVLALTLALTTMLWTADAWARVKRSGANNCGELSDALQAAQNGDVIIPMFDGGEGRNVSGAVIDKNLLIEGGWSPPAPECPDSATDLDTPRELLNAGFNYGGVTNRAKLNLSSDPLTLAATVTDLRFLAVDFEVQATMNTDGGALRGPALNGVNLRFDHAAFIEDAFNPTIELQGDGGGLFLDITGGSRVTMRDVQFSNLAAQNGGGFAIIVRGGSHLMIDAATISGNDAVAFSNGRGGGGRIILESGYVTITNSLFTNNSAALSGGALSIQRLGSSGPAEVWLINNRFSGNSAPSNADVAFSGSGLTVHTLAPAAFLPLQLLTRTPSATISDISRAGDLYQVAFTVNGFAPALSGQHVHFFFDTVPPEQAGMPANPANWYVYAGGSPFSGYGVADRPFGATRMCVLVANAAHEVIQNTGNCVALP